MDKTPVNSTQNINSLECYLKNMIKSWMSFSFFLRASSFLVFFLSIWLGGFVYFCVYVLWIPCPQNIQSAQGFVVLTGGRGRIHRGLFLLEQHPEKEFLITGVSCSKKQCLDQYNLSSPRHSSITLGSKAKNTLGNAEEAMTWRKQKNLNKLIVVTSDYHVPRSRLLFSWKDPLTQWIFYPVVGDLSLGILVKEYHKLAATFVLCTTSLFLQKKESP